MRSAIRDYTERTGSFLTKQEYDAFLELMKLSSDYQDELAQSLLFSWDRREYVTTNAFDALHKKMKSLGLRKPDLLEQDLRGIRSASRRHTVVEGRDGAKHEFSRELILEGMAKNEIGRRNTELVSKTLAEFVRR